MPKVSILVPTYNVSQYLDECMKSLIHQTLKDIEIICINDGSTDNSLEILQRYAAKDNRIKIIDKENGGYGIAMNMGLEQATGEYVGILEPDDYVKLNMYEILYNIAKKENLDFIKADFYRFVHDENGKLILHYHQLSQNPDLYNRVINPYDEPEVFRLIMNTWSGIYKRSFLLENNIKHHETPGASFQDNGFWFKTFCYAKRTYFVNKPFYLNRRDNPNSSVHNKEKVFCMNDEYAYIHKFMEDNPKFLERFMDQYSFRRYHNYINSYHRVGEEYKDMYLERFQKEFKEAYELGELRKENFTEYEWEGIQVLLENALAFKYFMKYDEKREQYNKMKAKYEDIAGSTSFRIGKSIMALPCKIKDAVKGK